MNPTLPAPASVPAPPLRNSRSASLSLIPSVVVVVSLAATLVLLSGCATTPIDRAAKLLASTVQTVDSAMTGYADLVARDLIDAGDQAQVKKLYTDYQAAEAVAETAITTAIKTGHAGRLAATSAALTAARDPLLAFLARFTTSPP